LFLLLSCLSCLLLGLLVGQATATETNTGLDVMLVVDNSNSMFDKGGIGSDPKLRRIEAAQMFISYLGVDSDQAAHRLGVVFFGGEAELVAPLIPLADRTRRAEMALLIADPQRMDWTDPVAALALARDTLLDEQSADCSSPNGKRPVVVLLTDGKPEWDGNPSAAERQAVVEELERLGQDYADEGIRLFTILLSNAATDADPDIEAVYAPLWRELAQATQGGFYPVRQADDLIDVYHDILVTLSGVQTDGPVVEAELGAQGAETQVEMIDIEPDLARVTFVVRISRDGRADAATDSVTVTVHRPDGEALHSQDADVQHAAYGATAIWTISRPQPGDWAVTMTGQGTVTVWKDYLPAPVTPTPTPSPSPTPSPTPTPISTATATPTPKPRLIVDEWPQAVLAGQPLTLAVSFDPEPLEIPAGLEQSAVWMEWRIGDAQPRRERLLDDGRAGDARAWDGWYSVSLTANETGTLLARVWGEVQGHEIAAWEGRLSVEPYPTLEWGAPAAGDRWHAGKPAAVQAHWAVGGEPLAVDGPMTITLRSPDDSLHTTATGAVDLPITLEAPQASGVYSLTAEAAGRTPTGVPFQGQTMTTIVVRRPLPGWLWIAGVGLSLAGLGGRAFLRWFRRLPRLEGRLRVLEAPVGYSGPTLIDLSSLNQRSAQVGGVKADLPVPPVGSPWAVVCALLDGSGMELTPINGRVVQVNDKPITDSYILSDKDCIETENTVGSVRLRYEYL